MDHIVEIPAVEVRFQGELLKGSRARGLVIFVSGTGRMDPDERPLAEPFLRRNLAVLRPDLVAADESPEDAATRLAEEFSGDPNLLVARLTSILHWAARSGPLPIGLFGTGLGAGAALIVASQNPETVRAVASWHGRPDLADSRLKTLTCPTLLAVGWDDVSGKSLNENAFDRIGCGSKRLEIVGPDAMLERMIEATSRWFLVHFRRTMADLRLVG